jgi:hypothetical protein
MPNNMKEKRFNKFIRLSLAVACAAVVGQSAPAQQVLYSENFDSPDSANNWTVNAASSRDTAEFAFDYSTVGVPAAPNSGGTTKGLLLRANRPTDVGALSGVSVSPNGQAFTGNYILEFDLWENFPGPAPGGGAGSTQLTGAGIMTSGTVAHYAGSGDGLWFAATGEGGSSIDYRVYFGGANQTTASLYPAGGQNQTATYYQTNFPGGVSAPAAQLASFPSQSGTTAAGTIGWAWHHVKIAKSGTAVTWDIDNIRMANVDLNAVTTTFGGDNILFEQSDINASQTTTDLDPVLFGLIDNVKVSTLPGAEVSAILMDPNGTIVNTISEADTTQVASFKITRPATDVSTDLTVNFTLGGTATRGDATSGDYFIRTNGVVIPTGTSVTIPAGSDNVLVEIVANDDNVSELTETIDFNLAPGAGYNAASPSGGTVSITDNDQSMVDISQVVFSQMYEGNTNDFIRFTLQRRGDLNAPAFDVNLSYAGTAAAGEDFAPISTVTFNPGDVATTVDIHPLNDSTTEDRETVVVSIASGASYAVGTNNVLTAGATGVIVDDDIPDGTVLFSDDFNTDSSANWTILFGSLNPDSQDYSATFAFDYGQEGFAIPPAPHSNGDTLGLLVSVNKLDQLQEAAGVNLYPNGKDFTGNYALRFDMYLMQNASAGTTEHAMFGINHDATHTNWFINSSPGMPDGWTFDGLFAAVVADASDLGDYLLMSGPRANSIPGPTTLAQRSASTLVDVFHNPPWTPGGGAGSPGNTPATATPSWAEVELRQTNNVVTLIINQTNIFSYTNSTASTHGDIMLGYDDSFNSIGSGGGGLVIYDNVRVVQLSGGGTLADVHISTINVSGNTVTIDFTAGSGEATSAFKLVSAPVVTGPYTDDNTATITSLGGSNYRITTTATDAMKFFQIRRAP